MTKQLKLITKATKICPTRLTETPIVDLASVPAGYFKILPFLSTIDLDGPFILRQTYLVKDGNEGEMLLIGTSLWNEAAYNALMKNTQIPIGTNLGNINGDLLGVGFIKKGGEDLSIIRSRWLNHPQDQQKHVAYLEEAFNYAKVSEYLGVIEPSSLPSI